MAGDGQVTLGDNVIKHSARKIRRLYQDKILAGFAGSTADAFSLFARFESKLEQYHGNLGRAAVELAKDWRTDKMLRQLEALLLVADQTQTFLISGQGDVIEPDTGIAAIGSGGAYATAAATALFDHTQLLGTADRRRSHEDCRQNLHLYQRQDHDRRVVRTTGRPGACFNATGNCLRGSGIGHLSSRNRR